MTERDSPPRLQLRLVQTVFRHGERTPVGHGFARFQQLLRETGCQQSLGLVRAPVLESYGAAAALHYRTVHERINKAEENNDIDKAKGTECYYGQLTDLGRRSATLLGAAFRKRYIEQLGFLPPSLQESQLYLRSTYYQRTFESLMQFVTGLYPSDTRAHKVLNIHTRTDLVESMTASSRCAKLRDFLLASRKQYFQNEGAEDTARMRQQLAHLPDAPSGSSSSSMMMFYDILVSLHAHGLPLPQGVTSEHVQTLERMAVGEWWSGLHAHQEMTRLAIGSFLGEIASGMRRAASFKSVVEQPYRLEAYSGHDSTIAPILCALGVFNGSWPRFAANLTFELLEADKSLNVHEQSVESATSSAPMFVRVRYNDEDMALPACAPIDKHGFDDPKLCTLDAFLEHMDKLTPLDLKKECELD